MEPIRRLLVCATGSIALHALTLAADHAVVAPPTYSALSASALSATLAPIVRTSQPMSADMPEAPVLEPSSLPYAPSTQRAEASDLQPRPDIAFTGHSTRSQDTAADKWYTADELDVRAEPLTSPEFGYPEELAGSRIEGRVRIALFVDEQGSVRDAKIVASQPPLLFNRAALQAWRHIRFSPALKGSRAVRSTKLVEIEFRPD